VLLLILDTVRAQSMSLYGYARRTTPHLATFARDAVLFENAIATSSWSLPSHASLFTGVWPHEQGGGYRQPVRGDLPSVVRAFRAAGYATAGFTANMGFAGHESGFAGGFEHYEDYPRNLAQLLLTPTLNQTQAMQLAIANARAGYLRGILYSFHPRNLRLIGVRQAARVTAPHRTERFLAWSARARPRPFFAFINLFDAHSPYEPPEPFRTAFGDGRREIDRYDGAIAYLDSVVHGVLAELQRRGDLERTLVVITSDHGELFREHGFDGHGNTLYLPAIHVPLVMRLPGRVPAGHRVPAPVSLRDIPATLLDLTGVPAPAIPGTSLRAAWTEGGAATLSPAFSEASRGVNVSPESQNYLGPIHSLLDSTTHYIRLAGGREELYDWRRDRDELTNLAASSGYHAILLQHRRTLDSLMPGAPANR
jgi:arylsulfatase A-like enzyme